MWLTLPWMYNGGGLATWEFLFVKFKLGVVLVLGSTLLVVIFYCFFSMSRFSIRQSANMLNEFYVCIVGFTISIP